MKMVIGKSKRCIFKIFSKEDMTEDYYEWFYNKEVTQFNSHGLFPYTEEQRKDFLSQIEMGKRVTFAVYSDEEEPVQIGNVDLDSINWINRSAQLSIVIGNTNFWGKGYGTEMCEFILEWGFRNLNLNRIWTGTCELNTVMRNIALKIGMEHEGVFKQGMFLNGEYRDIICYAITGGRMKTKQNDVSSTLEESLKKVEEIRTKNNILWIGLVKIATETEKGKSILKQIVENDKEISKALEKISEE